MAQPSRPLLHHAEELISQADKSLEMLSSISGFGDDEEDLKNVQRRINYWAVDSREINRREEKEGDLEMASSEISIRKGMVHLKAQFPDRTADYLDIEPRITTIGDVKKGFCKKRRDIRPEEIHVLFQGRVLEDDWLAVDCGIHVNGQINIVYKYQKDTTAKKSEFMVPSLSSVYANELSAVSAGNDESMLSIVSTSNFSAAREWEAQIRPEEEDFQSILIEFYEKIATEDGELHLNLLTEYQEITQMRLEEIEAAASNLNKQFQEERYHLRSERNTWRLLYGLRYLAVENELGMDTERELNGFMTEDECLDIMSQTDQQVRLGTTVRVWLESIYAEKVKFTSDRRRMGTRTLSVMRMDRHRPGLVRHLDPDAPDRENLLLEKDDMQDELELLQGVWGYLRSGQAEKAVDLCIQLGQPWLAASISGGRACGSCEEVSDDSKEVCLARWGNPNRALWKDMCWKVACKATGKDDLRAQYQQAIYAALSGNMDVLLCSPLCATWEDHCWVYVKCLIDRKEDEKIFECIRRQLEVTKRRSGPVKDQYFEQHLTRTQNMSTRSFESVFEYVRDSKERHIRVQSDDIYHRVQEKLVKGEVNELVSSILFAEICGAGDHSWNLQLEETTQADKFDPHFLRFAAHLVLFFESSEETFETLAGHMVLKAYIRHLVKHSQMNLIPFYVSKLPKYGCIEVYAQFLQRVTTTSDRQACLAVAEKFFPPEVLPHITKLVVETTIQQALTQKPILLETSLLPEGNALDITQDDEMRLRSIEWLCTYVSDRGEAIVQGNALIRYFVALGKDSAVHAVVNEIIPGDSLAIIQDHEQTIPPHELQYAIREYLCWVAYVKAQSAYHAWRGMASIPLPATFADESRYMKELMALVSDASAAIYDVLRFEHGWLRGVEFEQEEVHGMRRLSTLSDPWVTRIRRVCLPQLVFNLHYVLFETAKNFLRLKFHDPKDLMLDLLQKSLQIADTVADSQYKVYLNLAPKESRHLLDLARKSAIAIIRLDNELSI